MTHPAQVEHDAEVAAQYLCRLVSLGVPYSDAVAITSSYVASRAYAELTQKDAPLVVPPGLAS